MQAHRDIAALPAAAAAAVRAQVVISSPAEAVLELVANSLDAGAREVHVQLDLQAGGLDFAVRDDGAGVRAADLQLLGLRHATSKLAATSPAPGSTTGPTHLLGYRGEALAAIREAAAEVEVASRAAGSFETHTCLLRGGSVVHQGLALEQRKRQGTVVAVRGLFAAQPVRRKALATAGLHREADRCTEAITRLALLRPGVTFTLFDRGRKAFMLRLLRGRSEAESVADFLGQAADQVATVAAAPAAPFSIGGYAALPPHGHPSCNRQCIFLNGRWVKAPPVATLVDSLFQPLYKANMRLQQGRGEELQRVHKAANRHAAFVLHISCPPAAYDLSHEADGVVAHFRSWEPLLCAAKHAVLAAWRPALSNSLLRELEQLEGAAQEPGMVAGTAAVAAEGAPGGNSRGQAAAGAPARNACRSLQETEGEQREQESGTFQLWLQTQREEQNVDCGKLLAAAKSRGQSSGQQQDSVAEQHDGNAAAAGSGGRHRGSGRGRQLSGARHPLSSRLVRFNTATALPAGTMPVDAAHSGPGYGSARAAAEGAWSGLPGGPYKDVAPAAIAAVLGANHSIPQRPLAAGRCTVLASLMPVDQLGQPLSLPMDTQEDWDGAPQGQLDLLHHGRDGRVMGEQQAADQPAVAHPGWHHVPDEHEAWQPFAAAENTWQLQDDDDDISRLLRNRRRDPQEQQQRWQRQHGIQPPTSTHEGWEAISTASQAERGQQQRRQWVQQQQHQREQGQHGQGGKHAARGRRRQLTILVAVTEDERALLQAVATAVPLQGTEQPRAQSAPPQPRPAQHSVHRRQAAHGRRFAEKHAGAGAPDGAGGAAGDEAPVRQAEPAHQAAGQPTFEKQEQPQPTAVQEHRAAEGAELGGQLAPLQLSSAGMAPTCNSRGLDPGGMPKQASPSQPTAALPSFLQPDASLAALAPLWRQPAHRAAATRAQAGALDRSAVGLHNPGLPECQAPASGAAVSTGSVLTLDAVAAAAFAQLAPSALTRQQLSAGRALQQLDRKFIPVLCGSLVALVDQHAADERVQLERLRDELLGPDGGPRQAQSQALRAPLPLGLTSAEQQLLEAYRGQVQAWGWRWAQASRAAGVQLTHAPLLWGTVLTATDLKLYLHHLEDTCGAGGLPQGVVRVLNSKACRGAIMFGDELDQGQSQDLLDNLKTTQLCFSCAHGRPTTVPLVDLALLLRALALRAASQGAVLGSRGAPAAAGGQLKLAGLKAKLQRLVD